MASGPAHPRIADPADEQRTFSWLPEASYDPRGNAIAYEYMAETGDGVDLALDAERRRVIGAPGFAQRYLKRISYGNTAPLAPDQPIPGENRFCFEVVVDYGDHSSPEAPGRLPDRAPPVRPDPHSSFTAGFELRTWRLARRILAFHRFDALGAGATLVRTTRLGHALGTAGSTVQTVTHTGVRSAGAVQRRERPPLTFTYAEPETGRAFAAVPLESTENLPRGLSGIEVRFVDLFGEGLPGILVDDGDGWHYKRNLGGGEFEPQRVVDQRPASRLGRFALSDFDRDGNTNLVVMDGRDAGYYELDREEQSWSGFQPFGAAPHVEGETGHVELLDLSGDGRADVVVERSDRFTWYPSLGKDGFDDAVDIPKPAASPGSVLPTLGEDADLGFVLADMNGDGLPDLVRVRNGCVEYWPQIGNGRFGDAVMMEDSPTIDAGERLDLRRLHLVDLDGSGTADLLYVGEGEVRIWTNAAGNVLVERPPIRNLPFIEDLSSARVVDLLGDGTPCLVWSSALADRPAPMQYLPLAGAHRPRLLLRADNGIGLRTELTYGSAAQHYLRDMRSGRGWSTLVPGHPVVVERRDMVDAVTATRDTARFEYHDGRYDEVRRRFAGFGHVDRFEVDERTVVAGDADVVPAPGCLTRTFHHPGGLPDGPRPYGAWEGDALEPLLAPHTVRDERTLMTGEYLEALHALRGRPIREEVFALDERGARADNPLTVAQTRWAVSRAEPAGASHRPTFVSWRADTLVCSYEGDRGQQPVAGLVAGPAGVIDPVLDDAHGDRVAAAALVALVGPWIPTRRPPPSWHRSTASGGSSRAR